MSFLGGIDWCVFEDVSNAVRMSGKLLDLNEVVIRTLDEIHIKIPMILEDREATQEFFIAPGSDDLGFTLREILDLIHLTYSRPITRDELDELGNPRRVHREVVVWDRGRKELDKKERRKSTICAKDFIDTDFLIKYDHLIEHDDGTYEVVLSRE